MSVGVAVSKAGKLALATDSLFLIGTSKTYRSKLHTTPDWALAIGGEGVVWDFMMEHLEENPDLKLCSGRDLFKFLKGIYGLATASNLVSPGSATTGSAFGGMGVNVILACANGAWCTDGANAVYPVVDYEGVGAGRDFAMGYLHGVYGTDRTAQELACQAVETAIKFCASCGGTVESTSFDLRS